MIKKLSTNLLQKIQIENKTFFKLFIYNCDRNRKLIQILNTQIVKNILYKNGVENYENE